MEGFIAESYRYNPSPFSGDMAGFEGMMLAIFGIFMLVGLLIGVFFIVCYWRLFEKAGQPGWKALIPIYNQYVMLRIAGCPGWWLLLYFVPYANLVVSILFTVAFVQAFGRRGVSPVLLYLLLGVFYLPYMAFSRDVQYTLHYFPAWRPFEPLGEENPFGPGPAYAPPPGGGYGPAYGPPPGGGYGPAYGPPPGGGYGPAYGPTPGGGYNPNYGPPPGGGYGPNDAPPPDVGSVPSDGSPSDVGLQPKDVLSKELDPKAHYE